ncbi:MAG: hypothetical protein Q8761_03260, partial [Sweet potato little leaf phytoplasma]|nr:hypothetical protein [Sweet potato little leaf phytoplasma]
SIIFPEPIVLPPSRKANEDGRGGLRRRQGDDRAARLRRARAGSGGLIGEGAPRPGSRRPQRASTRAG